MKKILSVALAFVMVLSLSVCAFAAEAKTDVITTEDSVTSGNLIDWDNTKESSQAVNVTVGTADEEIAVYYVTVAWGNTNFEWVPATTGTWSPENHTYTGGTEAGWKDSKNTAGVVVTNHSNKAVNVYAEVTNDDANDNVTVTVSADANSYVAKTDSETLARGEEDQKNSAPNITFTIKVEATDTPTAGTAATVKVTVSPA